MIVPFAERISCHALLDVGHIHLKPGQRCYPPPKKIFQPMRIAPRQPGS
jgi:hypothetical protein